MRRDLVLEQVLAICGEVLGPHADRGQSASRTMGSTPPGISDSAILAAIEHRFGISLSPVDRHGPHSVHSLARLVEQKVGTAILASSIGVAARLEWAARTGGRIRSMTFIDEYGSDVEVPNETFIAIAAGLADTLSSGQGPTLPGKPCVIACRSPFTQALGFVAAILGGAAPLIVDIGDPWAIHRARRRVESMVPDCLVLSDDDRAVNDLLPSPAAAVLVLPDDPRDYPSGVDDEGWPARPVPCRGNVAWLQTPTEFGGSTRTTTLPITQVQANTLLMSLTEISPPHLTRTVVSWFPLSDALGVAAGLVWPLLTGRSSVIISHRCFQKDPAVWLGELGRSPWPATMSPPHTLAEVARRVSRTRIAGIDLSGTTALATHRGSRDDHRLTEFTERFGPLGFRPAAFRFDSRLGRDPR